MIDSHCHLDFAEFDGDRTALLAQCAQAGITALIVPGVAPAQWGQLHDLTLSLAASPCRVYAAAGLHPWWVQDEPLSQAEFKQRLGEQLEQGTWVAIGECGLDGRRAGETSGADLPRQVDFLTVQLQLACDVGLPLILHAHAAHAVLLPLLRRYRPAAGGVIHGFAGSLPLAQDYLKLGFRIGVGGTITYPRAAKTRATLAALPLEALLLETDAPAMPLCGQQGQANSPLHLPEVARTLATLRGQPLETVVRQTQANTRQLFSLP